MKVQHISELSNRNGTYVVKHKKRVNPWIVIAAVVLIAAVIVIVIANSHRRRADNSSQKVDHDLWLEFYDQCYLGFLEKNNIDEAFAEYDSLSREYRVDYDDGTYECSIYYRKPATDVIGFGISLNSVVSSSLYKPLKVSFNDHEYYFEIWATLLDGGKISHYVGIDERVPGQDLPIRYFAFLIDGDGVYQYENEDIPELSEGEMKIINTLMPDIKNLVKISEDMLVVWDKADN